MAHKLIDAAQARWRAVNASHLVALVRSGARFHKGKLLERARHHTNRIRPISRNGGRLKQPHPQVLKISHDHRMIALGESTGAWYVVCGRSAGPGSGRGPRFGRYTSVVGRGCGGWCGSHNGGAACGRGRGVCRHRGDVRQPWPGISVAQRPGASLSCGLRRLDERGRGRLPQQGGRQRRTGSGERGRCTGPGDTRAVVNTD